MSLSLNIPFYTSGNTGVLQYMKSHSQLSNILFSYSTIVNGYTPDKVLKDDSSYFSTEQSPTKESNYLIIELKDRVLYTKGYVIASIGTDTDYMRSWKLYGSLLGYEWTLIHQVDDKDDLNNQQHMKYRTHSGVFRFFKIVQSGNACGTSSNSIYKLRISYCDFFGYMTNTIKKEITCKSNIRSISFLHSIAYIIVS